MTAGFQEGAVQEEAWPWRQGVRVYLAIGVGLLVALGLVAGSWLLAARNGVLLERVARTQDARAGLAEVLIDIENAETGQRGYLLTGKESYLAPYERGSAETPAAIDRIAGMLEVDGVPEGRVDGLRAAAADKLQELGETIALARAGDRSGALDVVQNDRGERDMTVIRKIIGELEEREATLLGEQIAAVNWGGRLLFWADAVGFVLLALLVAAIVWGARQGFRTILRAQADLVAANASLEDRVAARTAALTDANEEIQRFAYIVSHDLRAPLVNIMGFTAELDTAFRTVGGSLLAPAAVPGVSHGAEVTLALEEDIPEALGFIRTSTQKMDRLIGAILALSREGRRVMTPEPIGMQVFLETIAGTMRHQARERGAEVVVQDVPDVVSDRLMLEQVFANLIDNALKYLQPGRPGRILVTGRVAGDRAVFDVEDNGRGIAPHDRERVFELFRRAGDQTVPGEGIGLAHVRALVRRLGGRIDCVAREGVGSTFRVSLPRGTTPADPKGTM